MTVAPGFRPGTEQVLVETSALLVPLNKHPKPQSLRPASGRPIGPSKKGPSGGAWSKLHVLTAFSSFLLFRTAEATAALVVLVLFPLELLFKFIT